MLVKLFFFLKDGLVAEKREGGERGEKIGV